MGFFNKIMATVGIGGVKVDTILNSKITKPGGEISGIVNVKGGNVDQDIKDINLSLIVRVKEKDDDDDEIDRDDYDTEKEYKEACDDAISYDDKMVIKHMVTEGFKIRKGEHLEFPFKFQVPLEVPVSIVGAYKFEKIKLFVETELELGNFLSNNKEDKDYVEVEALPNMVSFFDAILKLGFIFYKADVEEGRKIAGSNYKFFQEIEFYPSSQFPNIKELEITFLAKPQEVLISLEIDKKRGGDTARVMTIPYDDSNYNYIAELEKVLKQS